MNKLNLSPQQKLIFAAIDESIELAERKGKHPLEPGCICILCVNRRKELLYPRKVKYKYSL